MLAAHPPDGPRGLRRPRVRPGGHRQRFRAPALGGRRGHGERIALRPVLLCGARPSPPAAGHGERSASATAGALLKYSFDEVGQDRSVTIVDIDAVGPLLRRGRRPPPPPRTAPHRGHAGRAAERRRGFGARQRRRRRFARPIQGRLHRRAPHGSASGARPASDASARSTRTCCCIERVLASLQPGELQPSRDRRQLDHDQLFAAFFNEMTGPAADGRRAGRVRRGGRSRRRPRPGGAGMKPLRLSMRAFGPYAGEQSARFHRARLGHVLSHPRPDRCREDVHPRRHLLRALRRGIGRRARPEAPAQRPRGARHAHRGRLRFQPRRREPTGCREARSRSVRKRAAPVPPRSSRRRRCGGAPAPRRRKKARSWRLRPAG